jgi:hypothetical protein
MLTGPQVVGLRNTAVDDDDAEEQVVVQVRCLLDRLKIDQQKNAVCVVMISSNKKRFLKVKCISNKILKYDYPFESQLTI